VCLPDPADGEWLKSDPEDQLDWINMPNLEAGSDYDVRIVAMNDGDEKTISETTKVQIGRNKGTTVILTNLILISISGGNSC